MAAEPLRSGAPSLSIDAGTGPTVVFIHGQPGSGADWWPVAELLTDDHHVLAPDRPGWGNHPRPATTLLGNADSLVRMLGHEPPDAPLVIVGHSLGGGIALELALGWPELVGALVLVSSVGTRSALGGMDVVLAVPVVGSGVLRAGAAMVGRGARALTRLSLSPKAEPLFERANRFPGVRSFLAESDREMDGRGRRSFMVEQKALLEETPSIERRLASLRVPCAVVQGAKDRVVSLASARDLAGAIPGAELVVCEGAGHRLAFERPQVIADVVRRYERLMAD